MTIRLSIPLALQAKFFHGLADASRLAIMEALRDGPLCVSDIVRATGLSQSNTSNHLACLRECGLVVAEPRGRFVHYRLADGRIDDLLALTDELIDEVATGVAECRRYNPARRK
jgi:DNA-binding transcriptional ArsR family regulator